MITSTHTFAVLDIPADAYAAVRKALENAGPEYLADATRDYHDEGELIHMPQIALRSDSPSQAIARGHLMISREEYESLQRDKARLDFLDRCNTGMNAHCKTLYGWELVRSPNITRIMTRSPFSGELAAVDLNDANAVGTHGGGVLSCRVAIDKGMAQYQRQVDPAEDQSAVNRLVSARLMEWSRSWILDGDVVRCRKCKRGINWSNRGDALNHQAECPQKMAYPWSLLTSLPIEDSARPA